MEGNKKHILLIITWFPPQNGVAVNRMHAFVKYLDINKYTISVITLQENKNLEFEIIDGAAVYRLKNSSLLKTIKTRAGEFKLIHYLKVLWNVGLNTIKSSDLFVWKKNALALIDKIHRDKKIDLIISSYSPVETHLIANSFCTKNSDIKWIADMRDEMSKNPHITAKQRKLYLSIEHEINKKANAITTVSKPILADFKISIPNIQYYEEIRNGFDHDLQLSYNYNEIFTISYAGTFYGANKPDTFFEGLSAFVDSTNAVIKLQFIGTNKNFSIPARFKNNCEFIPKVSQIEAIEIMFKADCNLLILPSVNRKGVYSGKIFDYLSVLKPIVAIVDTTDVAAQLILEYNAGFVASFDNSDQIQRSIADAYDLWKNKKALPVEKDKIALLHRKFQVKKLEMLIDKLLVQ